MRISRFFLPVFIAFALLTAQQAGAAHALSHALESLSEQDKQVTPHHACEKCATFADLSNAPAMGIYTFPLPPLPAVTFLHPSLSLRLAQAFTPVARGPPASPIL